MVFSTTTTRSLSHETYFRKRFSTALEQNLNFCEIQNKIFLKLKLSEVLKMNTDCDDGFVSFFCKCLLISGRMSKLKRWSINLELFATNVYMILNLELLWNKKSFLFNYFQILAENWSIDRSFDSNLRFSKLLRLTTTWLWEATFR